MNASDTKPCRQLVEHYGLKLADHTDIAKEILKMMRGRDEEWPWVEKWIVEEAPGWTNSPATFVFEVIPGSLADQQALNFAQEVWMCQPSLFEHQTWNGRMFARMTWEKRHF